jgi:hypothetical protein
VYERAKSAQYQKEATMLNRKFCNLVLGITASALLTGLPLQGQSGKNQAQKLVNMTIRKHPEVTGLELSAAPAGQRNCITIAATEGGDLGQACDEDENAALKTMQPYVEHEADGYDVTAPLHDANGRLAGVLGIDFKPEAGQTNAQILELTARLLGEMERQIPSKAFLFRPFLGN